MDLLAAQPGVDKPRLGFVGHDYGGRYGMIMAGVDPRAKTCVYVAVAPSLSHWAFFARQPRSKTEYLRQNAPLELTDYLRQVKSASTLFQFALRDTYVSRADTAVVLAAAPTPKERKFYDAEHSMTKAAVARRSRRLAAQGAGDGAGESAASVFAIAMKWQGRMARPLSGNGKVPLSA